MACPKCGKPLGEAVRMGAMEHECAEPAEPIVEEVPKPVRRRTPKPKPEDKPEE